MAALLDGTLASRELAETTAHLRDCPDCRTILGETARFEREGEGEAILPVRETGQTGLSLLHSWRLRLVAAAVAAIALLVPVTRYVQYRTSPIRTLIAAAPREHRPTVARVSDYPFARPPALNRGSGRTAEQLQLDGAAGKVIERTANLDTVEARRWAGVANLLIGQTSQSVDLLARAAEGSKDARVWNDLAAARHAVGEARHDAEAYRGALTAVDRAIELDPKLAEAHFNRALILEALGLPGEAVKAWDRYLELDPSSEWAREARDRRARLLPKKSANFKEELERARRDHTLAAVLVNTFPQEARKYGEATLLLDWATAEANGEAGAQAELAFVRAIGKQLAARGDSFLADVVATIDDADATRRIALVAAHQLHGSARIAYANRDLETAETGLREAEAAFRAAGSPMAEAAAYYLAQATFDRNRTAEAVESLNGVLSRIDPRRYRGLDADVRWQLAVAATARADWDTALREGTLSSKTFEQLGETHHAAFMAGSVAHALERLGAIDEAAAWWTRAFAGLRDNTRRRADLLHSAALALAQTERPEEAAAMLRIAEELGDKRPFYVANLAADRAVLRGDTAPADRDLREARSAAAMIKAADMREATMARIDVSQAAVHAAADPRAALPALNRAVAFFRQRGIGIDLPEAYLQRARAHRAADDTAAALADYDSAMRQVEQQLPRQGSQSLAFLDTAARILDDTIELHLDRGEPEKAFAVADRAHAMLDKAELGPIPERTALIEYVLLPKRVAIFCRRSDGLTAVTVNVPQRDVARRANELADAIRGKRSEEEIRAQAAELHRILIAPVARLLTDVDELVLVRDRQLQTIPFAVLFDGQQYLVERYAIRYAPSAAKRPKPARTGLAPAVAFGDPAAPDWPSLAWGREEAHDVSAIHGATLVTGTDATRARFLEALQRSALVHYAGHADSDAATHGALMLAPSKNDTGILGASDIARLSLHERSPLVVLSACGTLRGEVRHVAGMPTLARAFLTAGARAVVGTQWEVNDELTKPLFIRFHEELRADQAPAHALRTAQIAMLQTSDPRHKHPAAWSAVAVLSNL